MTFQVSIISTGLRNKVLRQVGELTVAACQSLLTWRARSKKLVGSSERIASLSSGTSRNFDAPGLSADGGLTCVFDVDMISGCTVLSKGATVRLLVPVNSKGNLQRVVRKARKKGTQTDVKGNHGICKQELMPSRSFAYPT